MTPLRALYVDDEEIDLRNFGSTLRTVWDRILPRVPLDLKTATFEEERELFDRGERFDLYLIDVIKMDKDSPKPFGLGLIRDLRTATEAAIIGLSEDPEQVEAARASFAHEALSKAAVAWGKDEYVWKCLTTALNSAEINLASFQELDLRLDDPDDLRLVSAVETVGTNALAGLISGLIPEAVSRVELGYVRPGLSGAVVLRCRCELELTSTGPGARSVILKTMRDLRAIGSEHDRWQETTLFPGHLFPKLVSAKVSESDGWYGLAVADANGVTLGEWLDADSSTERVETVLSQLWLDGLAKGYALSTGDLEMDLRPTEAIFASSVGVHRGARILLAARRLEALAIRYGEADKAIFERIRRFVRFERFGEVDKAAPARGVWRVRAHGDLHGGNVLVDDYGHVMLLDPAHVDRAHWAADWARLIVDLLLSALSNRIDAYEWQLLSGWRRLVTSMVSLEELKDADLLSPQALTAINWMTRERAAVFANVGEDLPIDWEMQLAVAAELLRGTYRVESLPPAIRVLALLAGADALKMAGASWQNSSSDEPT